MKSPAEILKSDGLPDVLNRLIPHPHTEQETPMISITSNRGREPINGAVSQAATSTTTQPSSTAIPDFTAFAHPCLAITCPSCASAVGEWCWSPTARKLPDLHAPRKQAADAAWEHSGLPPIIKVGDSYVYDGATPPPPAADAAKPEESEEMKTPVNLKRKAEKPAAGGSKIQQTTAKNRREVGSVPARTPPAKPLKKPDLKATTTGSGPKPKNKSEIVHKMLISPTGATRKEMSAATGWPSVNLTVAAARAGMTLVEDTATGKCRLLTKEQIAKEKAGAKS